MVTAKDYIEDTKRFFREKFKLSLLPHEEMPSISPGGVSALKDWQTKTSRGSIIMPTIIDFYRKVSLAIYLFPQKNKKKEIGYLFGKGIGVEIALQGEVKGRRKRVRFVCRSHSDFELYNFSCKSYPPAFREVFGAQEFYPPTKTKGLENIPNRFMSATAEEVNLGGFKVYIPELELLFLDKLISRESTPRKEGYDAVLLAKAYKLDKKKTLAYLEEFYIKWKIKKTEKDAARVLEEYETTLTRNIKRMKVLLEKAREEVNKEKIVREVNAKMELWEGTQNIIIEGLSLEYWVPLELQSINEEGRVVDNNYRKRVEENIVNSIVRKNKEITKIRELVKIIVD
ncbi:MAG: hypothetical protein WC595_03195 [Candidatus Nanoarchaeia archaeon]